MAIAQCLQSSRICSGSSLLLLLLLTSGGAGIPACAQAQSTKDQVAAARNALDLKIYQASADALVAQREAEIRKATAEAERAELLAKLPPVSSKALEGTSNTGHFGAAGLVKAFDLAQQLALDVCAVLPADRQSVIHEAASTQGVVAARMVNDGIAHLSDDLVKQNRELQLFIDRHSPPSRPAAAFSIVGLAVVPATVKAVADITSLFKTDVTAAGIAYGDGARSMFATSLGKVCRNKIVGLGSGYLGELDPAQHEKLLAKVRILAALRGDYANRISIVQKLADGAKGDKKKELAAAASAAGALLKTVDTFVDSLKVGEASDKSPLFNAARYLTYAQRTAGALVLEYDLRLEGLTIIKDHLFTGQRLRLSGVAFLWFRLYDADGTLRLADAVRRITAPVAVDLRGKDVEGDFWAGPASTHGAAGDRSR